MKHFQAIFKNHVYSFTAPDPLSANQMAKQYAAVNNLQSFKLIQIGL